MDTFANMLEYYSILTYLIILVVFGGASYLTFISYFPKKNKRIIPTPSAPVDVKGTTPSGYEAEWIPEHHLKTRARKVRAAGAASSGDESTPEKSVKSKKK
jgi:hypothetical protein